MIKLQTEDKQPMPKEDFTSCGATLIGRSIRVLPEVTSTNELLKAEAEECLALEGAVIITENQTAGRGRLDRIWESPPGKSLLFSLMQYPEIPKDKIQLIGLMASLAVLNGLEVEQPKLLNPQTIHLKWPNDLLVAKRKLCGILSETGVDKNGRRFTVVGIGINVNQILNDFPEPLQNTATSLYIMTNKEHSRTILLKSILASMEDHYNRLLSEGVEWIPQTWLERAGIKGKKVKVKDSNNTISGTCLGLNPDGALQLMMPDDSIQTIYSGDVS